MRSFTKHYQILCLIIALFGFFALVGCGGGGGGGDAGTGAVVTPTVTSDVALTGVVSDTAGTASIRQAIRQGIVANASVTCRYYDDNGNPQTVATSTTTDANGYYTLKGLTRGWKNLIVEAYKNGATYSVVVPALPETTDTTVVASAPLMNPDSGKQTIIVDAALGSKLMKPKELNLGDILNILPPEVVAKLSEAELKAIATKLQDRQQARNKIVTEMALPQSLFDALMLFAQKLAQEIQQKIANGDTTYVTTGWDILFNQKIEAEAKRLGLPADAWQALRKIDTDSFAGNLKTVIANNGDSTVKEKAALIDQKADAGKYNNIFVALIQAFKELKDVGELTTDEISGLETMFNQMATGLQQTSDHSGYIKNHPGASLIVTVLRKIIKNLGLFNGNPPLIASIMPTQTQVKAAGLSWYPPFEPTTTPPTPPTPEQVFAFENYMRKAVLANLTTLIATNETLRAKLGNDIKIRALIFIIMGPKDIGFDTSSMGDGTTTTTTGTPTVTSNQIMGIIKKLATPVTIKGNAYDYSIQPPTGFPAAPKEWTNLLGYLRAGTGVTMSVSASDNVTDSFLVTVEMEAAPSTTQAPAFKVTAIKKNDATGTTQTPTFSSIQKFFGKLLKDGEVWYIVNPQDGTTKLLKLTVTTALLGTLVSGDLVNGEGEVKPPAAGATFAEMTVKLIAKFTQPTTPPTTTPTGTPTTTPTTTPTVTYPLPIGYQNSGVSYLAGILTQVGSVLVLTEAYKLDVTNAKWVKIANATVTDTTNLAANFVNKAVLVSGAWISEPALTFKASALNNPSTSGSTTTPTGTPTIKDVNGGAQGAARITTGSPVIVNGSGFGAALTTGPAKYEIQIVDVAAAPPVVVTTFIQVVTTAGGWSDTQIVIPAAGTVTAGKAYEIAIFDHITKKMVSNPFSVEAK